MLRLKKKYSIKTGQKKSIQDIGFYYSTFEVVSHYFCVFRDENVTYDLLTDE